VSGIGARVALAFGALARVFGNPGLRRLELAWLGSSMGHWTYVVALSVYAYDQGGVTAVGVITVLRLLPAAVASVLGQTVRDLIHRMFGGSSEALVMSLVKSRQIDPDKLAELSERIAASEKGGAK
jgi:hypothetical protein